MKFVITVFGLALWVATAGATPVTTLSAGLYTFSNISCAGEGCAEITASASTISTSEYGGTSAITFSDNGGVVPPPAGVQLTYDVSYSGVDPRSYSTVRYLQTLSGTPYFAGFEPFDLQVTDTEGGVLVGGAGAFPSLGLPLSLPIDNVGTSSFSVFDALSFGDLAISETTPGEFTTTYAAVDAPEPSSFGLCVAIFGVLLIGVFRFSSGRAVSEDAAPSQFAIRQIDMMS